MNAEEARTYLLGAVGKGDVVYSVIRHVSSSGLSRDISFFVVKDGGLVNISNYIVALWGGKPKERNGGWVVRVRGTGMDMAFSIVYDLAHTLFKDGYALESRTV